MKKIANTAEAWESGELGQSVDHVKVVSKSERDRLEKVLGLCNVTIKMTVDLDTVYGELAEIHGMDKMALMREVLERFAVSELKSIVTNLATEKRHNQSIKRAA